MGRLALFFGATMLVAWLAAPPAAAQLPQHNEEVTLTDADPTGACSNGRSWTNTATDERFHCYGKTWHSAGIGAGLSFPLAPDCGTIDAPSYSFAGGPEMGLWCTSPTGTLVLQNKYNLAGGTAGRSRLSLGNEFWSVIASRAEDSGNDVGTMQCFDEGGGAMICRVDVTADASIASWRWLESHTDTNRQLRSSVFANTFGSGCEFQNQLAYSFTGKPTAGLCYDAIIDRVELTTNLQSFSGRGYVYGSSLGSAIGWYDGSGNSNGFSVGTGMLFQVVNKGVLRVNEYGLNFEDTGTRPVCSPGSPDTRGTVWFENGAQGGLGIHDTLEVCMRSNESPSADYIWRPLVGDPGGLDFLMIEEEFLVASEVTGTVGKHGWRFFEGSLVEVAPTSGHPGQVRITCDTALGDRCALYMGDSTSLGAIWSQDIATMTFEFQVDSLTDTEVQIGVLDDADTTAAGITDGAWLDFTPATSANWRTITEASNVQTVNTSATAVATGQWYTLEIQHKRAIISPPGPDTWRFILDGTTLFDHTTNGPSAAVIPVFRVTKTTAADKTLLVDYFDLKSLYLDRR